MKDAKVMRIMQDASEVIHYECPDFPVYIKHDNLAEYPGRKALCHWHDDIELIHILEGKMNYHINGRNVLLDEQDCLFINSRQLHYGHSHLNHDCRFICIRFHPKLLNGSPAVFKDYVLPVIENGEIGYLHYDSASLDRTDITEAMTRILSLKTEMKEAYELEIMSLLHSLWHIFLRRCRSSLQSDAAQDQSDLALQKKMVSYIYEHYQETLTLERIAASASISRSKCCLIFKQYLQQSPIDFLNRYRLEASRYFLMNTSSGITEIALSCGFNHLSYFSKIFQRAYGCTPTEYRKRHALV